MISSIVSDHSKNTVLWVAHESDMSRAQKFFSVASWNIRTSMHINSTRYIESEIILKTFWEFLKDFRLTISFNKIITIVSQTISSQSIDYVKIISSKWCHALSLFWDDFERFQADVELNWKWFWLRNLSSSCHHNLKLILSYFWITLIQRHYVQQSHRAFLNARKVFMYIHVDEDNWMLNINKSIYRKDTEIEHVSKFVTLEISLTFN